MRAEKKSMSAKRNLESIFLVGLLLALLGLINGAPNSKKELTKLPSFLKVCHRDDPQLNICARNSFNALKPRFVNGIPELYIPPLDPLIIPEIRMDQDSGAVYLHSTYKNIVINGLSNFTLKDLEVDPVKMKMKIGMDIPKLSLTADYKIKGKIMLMPLVGEGPCNAEFHDMELTMRLFGEKVKKNGRYFVKIKDIKMQYSFGDVALKFENLFNGDDELGQRVNKFMNENWESLSEEIRPLLENAMTEIVRSSTDKLFSKYSFDDLLPE